LNYKPIHNIEKMKNLLYIVCYKSDKIMNIDKTEARHLIRLIDKDLQYTKQSVVSEIRLRELKKRLFKIAKE